MCSASQTAFSTFSDQLLKSANLRKIQTLCPVTLARAKTLLEPRFFPLSHKGLDKLKISVYTPNYERTLASTKRSSIG